MVICAQINSSVLIPISSSEVTNLETIIDAMPVSLSLPTWRHLKKEEGSERGEFGNPLVARLQESQSSHRNMQDTLSVVINSQTEFLGTSNELAPM